MASSTSSGFSAELENGWRIEFQPLPSDYHDQHGNINININGSISSDHNQEGIIVASIPLPTLYAQNANACDACDAFTFTSTSSDSSNVHSSEDAAIKAKVKSAQVALADYAARTLSNLLPVSNNINSGDDSLNNGVIIQTMGQSK